MAIVSIVTIVERRLTCRGKYMAIVSVAIYSKLARL